MSINPIGALNPNPNLNPVTENASINPNHNLIDLQLTDGGGGLHDHADDIEMLALRGMSYTTLKDLIPSPPSSTASPTSGSSWREIPIKDPLVQHAAWAYLQPMAAARDEDERWCRRLRENCRGLWGCFNDVVLVMFKGLFADDGRDGDGDAVSDDRVG